jgi:hypothetical protein
MHQILPGQLRMPGAGGELVWDLVQQDLLIKKESLPK